MASWNRALVVGSSGLSELQKFLGFPSFLTKEMSLHKKRSLSPPAGDAASRSAPCVLFPPLGTGDLCLPEAVAARALARALARAPRSLRYLMGASASASLAPFHAIIAEGADPLLEVLLPPPDLGDISAVLRRRPEILAVETNWRFAPKANKLSAVVHAAVAETLSPLLPSTLGPSAANAGKLAGAEVAEVGRCYPVEVPPDHPLCVQHGLRAIIYVRPPNLNPARPDCLQEGKKTPNP